MAKALVERHSVAEAGISSSARIAELIRSDIASGALEPGERIRIAGLAERYGTSHLPVREALRIVEGEALVEMVPHRGTTVRRIDKKFVTNIWGVRAQIEAYLIRLAVDSVTPEQIRRICEVRDAFEAAAADGTIHEIVETNIRLHDEMYAAAENEEANRILRNGRELVVALRTRFGYTNERLAMVCDQHAMIVDMMIRRNGPVAEILVRQHCQDALESLLDQLED